MFYAKQKRRIMSLTACRTMHDDINSEKEKEGTWQQLRVLK